MSARGARAPAPAGGDRRGPYGVAEQAHPLLGLLFAALEARGLSWLLLRVPSSLATPSGDVDLLVAPEDGAALRAVAQQLGFVALPGWESAPNLLLVCYDAPSDRWLVLDVVTTIAFRSAGWRSQDLARRVLGRARLRRGIPVPAPGDAFWLLLLHCLLDKRSISGWHRERLAELAPAAAGSDVAATVLAGARPRWTPEHLVDAVARRAWTTLPQEGPRLAAELRRRRPASRRAGDAARRLRSGASKLLLVRRRRGLGVALVGPNGVGKSTLADGLRRGFPLESRVVYMGLWRARSGPLGGAAGAALTRPLRIWWRYLRARWHQARGRLVVFDRYVYEAALPPQPPHRALKRPYLWLLRHAVPRPDVVVVLDVPGPVAYRRKQENPPDELERERQVYRGLAAAVPGCVLVDASRGPDAVRADVMAVVWRRSAARWRRLPEQAGPHDSAPTARPSPGRRLASRGGSRRAQLALGCVLVPRILAGAARSLPPPVARSRIADAQLTGTRMTIVTLAVPGEPACAVVKLPTTAEGAAELHAEGEVLAALDADGRLGDWTRLLPRPLAAGAVWDQPYRVDSLASGHDLTDRLADPARRWRLLEAAAEAIHVLHRRTASAVVVDAALAERWVDAHLADLVRSGAGCEPRFAARAARLRAELRRALVGRSVTIGRIHGDYWPGNVLFSPDGSAVQGIVDWAGADAAGLALHDLLHLVLYSRRVVGGQGIGQIVRGELRAPSLSAAELCLLDRYAGWPPGGLAYRHALALWWLRHVALHARQQASSRDWRYRLWERSNVHAVLGAL